MKPFLVCFPGQRFKRSAVMCLGVLLSTFLSIGAGKASVTTLTLSGVTFADGGTATGSITEDLTTLTILSFNISTSGSAQLPATTFSSTAGDFSLANQIPGFTTNDLFNKVPPPFPNGPVQDLDLVFVVDPSGITLSNLTSLTESFVGSSQSPISTTLASGSVIVTPVPEISPLAMASLALVGVFGVGAFQRLARKHAWAK